MSTVIFKWNPSISSYSLKDYNKEKESMINHSHVWMNWSVWEHEKVRQDDTFYWLRVGADQPCGIVARGIITSRPYPGVDWSGRGRETYYVDFMPDAMFPTESELILTADTLEKAIPDFNWRGGHSGQVLSDEQAQKLDELWREHVLGLFREIYWYTRTAYMDLLFDEVIFSESTINVELSLEFPALSLIEYNNEANTKRAVTLPDAGIAATDLEIPEVRDLYARLKEHYATVDGVEHLAAALMAKHIDFDFRCS